ncbi:hypothetical protein BCR35DRAFT_303282 [Leucosporidium creatinivorum]|uniref:Uncharacterized protein n=1 Tax=Leucosporidium creatinivorum TaxID=106004 RepID=A0A1Y2FJS2_9BASI|nr:hypothetical protein BCR35DRAFT_303282 [Leucosporidium creatinivorum]
MKSFVMNTTTGLGVSTADFFSIIACWPDLHTLEFSHPFYSRDSALPGQVPQAAIRRLQLPLQTWDGNGILVALLAQATSTLCHLDLGKRIADRASLADLPLTLSASLVTAAPQLISFAAVLDVNSWPYATYAESDYLISTLSAFRDIQEVSLGILGFSFSAILPLLQPLLHLRTLSIGKSKLSADKGPFHELTSTAAIDFINGAAALKSLTLPWQMEVVWTKDELKQANSAAKEKGVRFLLE